MSDERREMGDGGQESLGEPEVEAAAQLSAAKTYDDLKLKAEGAPQADIPDIDIGAATAAQKAILEAMWAYFEALKNATPGSPMPPTTYEQIGAGHVGIASTLVGGKIWVGLYGEVREVQPSDYVPWQLLEMLQFALEKAKTKLTVSKELADIAAVRYNAAKTNARDNCYCPW